MGAAHNGRDDIAFFAADIGDTWEIAATTAGEQLDDAIGALPSGRYLVQVRELSDPLAVCWVCVGAFVVGASLTLVAGQGRRRVPLSAELPAIEFNVRAGDSDRVGAILTAGTGTIYVTRISAGA